MVVATAPGVRPTGPVVFTWDGQRYVRAGQAVPTTAVRAAVDTVLDASTGRLRGLTERLLAGQSDLATWQQQMAAELKAVHVAVGTVAHGGTAHMAPADYGFLGQRLRTQYEFLRGFATDLAAGRQPLNGQALARTALYGQAARGTFEETRRRDQRRRGTEEEQRVLHAAESCIECEEAADHWEPIGTLPEIGSLLCQANCLCTFEYRERPVDEDAA